MAKRRPEPEFDSEDDEAPPPGKNALSTNGQWLFGSLYAGLALIGFSFGVWAGASKSRPVEVAEVQKEPEKPTPQGPPAAAPPVTQPPVTQAPVQPPMVVEKEPEPMMKKEPEPTPAPKKEPEPAPKKKEPEPKKIDVKPVAFKELEPIFRSYCNNCHGAAGRPKAGVDLRTAAAILKGGNDGALVTPGDPEKSLLYLSVKPPNGTMPPDGKQGPNDKELKLIHDWIASGAKPRRTIRRRER